MIEDGTMVKYETKHAKSILNRMKVIDSWFWCRYTMNPYQGCEHACVYCDARSQRYYLHEDFAETIVVKTNAPQLLEKTLANSRSFLPDVVAMAGMCDAYQPLESQMNLTRKLLQILLKFHYPTFISTKSTLIEKDLSLLNEIGKDTQSVIAFTITTLDEDLANFLEPHAANPWERLRVLRKIAQNYPNILVGVNLMPIIPYLEDSKENLSQIVAETANVGGKFILFAPGVTLRDSQGLFFMKKLRKYCENHGKMDLFNNFSLNFGPSGKHPQDYYSAKNQQILQICDQFHIPTMIPRWIPSDFRKYNYMAAECLLRELNRLKMRGKNNMNLFWAAQNLHNLPDSLGNIVARKELSKYLKLTPQIRQIVGPFIKKPTSLDRFLHA